MQCVSSAVRPLGANGLTRYECHHPPVEPDFISASESRGPHAVRVQVAEEGTSHIGVVIPASLGVGIVGRLVNRFRASARHPDIVASMRRRIPWPHPSHAGGVCGPACWGKVRRHSTPLPVVLNREVPPG